MSITHSDILKHIMTYTIEHLAKALKKAREDKQLSQRALSSRAGIPQAQISKIENATVDLQASSLIALARALDLEVMLVPRNHVPVVEALVSASESPAGANRVAQPAYRLDEEDGNG